MLAEQAAGTTMRMGWVGRHGDDGVGDCALAMAGAAKAVVKMVRRDSLRIMLPPYR